MIAKKAIFRFPKCLSVFKLPYSSEASSNIVEVSQGSLKGLTRVLPSGRTFNSFQGIPYARPPIGAYRFKPPEPAEAWTGIRDATKDGNACTQKDIITQEWIGDEDCLYLNVYTPKVKPEKPLPVMVWIHGGAFHFGSGNSDMHGPDFLMEEEIVLVTFNYRLGPLGFLALDTPEVPGNAGSRDQVAALRWVRDNIKSFGGDSNNVTLFGESAGASSVQFLSLSPMGKGLFHRAIMESGNALVEWAFTSNPVERAFLLGKALGKDAKNKEELFDFLKSASAQDLWKAAPKGSTPDEKRRGLPITFTPVAETVFPGLEPFLTDHPMNIINSKKYVQVPTIIGYNNGEGLAMIGDAKKKLAAIDSDFECVIPRNIDAIQKSDKSVMIANKIKKFYFGDSSVDKTTLPQLVDLLSDVRFFNSTILTVKALTRTQIPPVYLYRFEFEGGLNLFKQFFNVAPLAGAAHGDEQFYLFKVNVFDIPVEPKSPTEVVQKRMVKLWTNFAKTGNPTPEINDLLPVIWEPATKDKLNYLNIGKDLSVGVNPEADRLKFWDDLYTMTNGGFENIKLS